MEKHFRELGRKVIFLSGSREQRPSWGGASLLNMSNLLIFKIDASNICKLSSVYVVLAMYADTGLTIMIGFKLPEDHWS